MKVEFFICAKYLIKLFIYAILNMPNELNIIAT